MTPTRRRVAELMDDPHLDESRHRAALRALARLNRAAGLDGEIWRVLAPLVRGTPRPVRLLDVAAGSADLPVRLGRRAAREGRALELHACDISPVALACARENAEQSNLELRIHQVDAVHQPLPGGFDVAHCGLFLHHLDPSGVEIVLRRMAEAAATVIVQDLCRSWLGLALVRIVPLVLTRSGVVRTDAVRSARAAYTVDEMREMAGRAGLTGASVRPLWPERVLLVWKRPT